MTADAAPAPALARRLVGEAIGSFFLFATVVGSGIMGEALSGGNDAIALLGNTLATGAMLYVLIVKLGPLSGAHFNAAVTLAFALRRKIAPRDASSTSSSSLRQGCSASSRRIRCSICPCSRPRPSCAMVPANC